MTSGKKTPDPDDKSPEVDRIRDIIFGSQMRTYDGNFQTIQRDLDRHLQEIERLNEKLAEQEKMYSQKLQSLEREMRKADDSLRAELRETVQRLTEGKVDRQMLGDLFVELGSQLKADGSFAGTVKETLQDQED